MVGGQVLVGRKEMRVRVGWPVGGEIKEGREGGREGGGEM